LKHWWTRSRLRTKIFLTFSLLILGVILLTLGATQLMVERQVQETLRRELLTTGQVFQGLVEERTARVQTSAMLLANDFALKRVLTTYAATTLTSAAQNYQQRLGVDLFWMADEHGVLLADAQGRQPSGTSLAPFSPLKEALNSGESASAIVEVDGGLFQLVAVPVYGPDVIGFLVLGQGVDDTLAEQLRENTGSHISFLTATHLFASSLAPKERATLASFTAFSPFLLQGHAQQEPFLSHVNDERFISLVVTIEATLDSPLYALVLGSYDKAFASFYVLRQQIIVIGAGGLLLALTLGVGLAGGITSPVQTLVVGMREVRKGNLGYRSAIQREDEIGFLAQSFNAMLGGLEEREKIRDIMNKIVSPEIAHEMLQRGVALGGEVRESTVLFADIRGFTSLSEGMPPEELLQMLNAYLGRMCRVIERENGVIDKYIGDEVMAIFGAPLSQTDHALRAVTAALGMLQELTLFNQEQKAISPIAPMLRIGIGIASGPVIAGNVGSPERLNYTVLGDTVNLASRLQGLTKEYHVPLIISGATHAHVATEFPCRSLGKAAVRGRQEETDLYTAEQSITPAQ
jgi:adenylate cyclase